MSEHIFGVRNGYLHPRERDRRDSIATKHGAVFTYVRLCDGLRSWFSCTNLGDPHDSNIRRAVLADLDQGKEPQ